MNGQETTGKSSIGPEQWEKLKPFISRCLKLNHDLNNSLTGIIGYSEFIMDDSSNLTDEQRYHLDQILICAERIRKYIDNLCEEKIALAEEVGVKPLQEL